MAGVDVSRTKGQGAFLNVKQASYVCVFSIVAYLVLWIICVVLDGQWYWIDNNICDLGVSDVAVVRVMYMIACLLAGTGFVIFGYNMERASTRPLLRFTFMVYMIFGFVMIALGVITLDIDSYIHVQIARSVAVFSVLGLFTNALDDLLQHKYVMVILTAIVGATTLYLNTNYPELQQTYSAICMLILVFIRCIMLRFSLMDY